MITSLQRFTECPAFAKHDKHKSAASLDALPGDLERGIRRPQDQAVADELVAANEIAALARLQIVGAMSAHGAGPLVDRVGAEIGDVVLERDERLVGCHHRAGALALDVRGDLHRHLAVRAVIDHTLRIGAAVPVGAVDARADIAPGADQPRPRRLRFAALPAHHVTETYWVSINSIMPSCAPSRPRPDCLVPPNGAAGSDTRPRFN